MNLTDRYGRVPAQIDYDDWGKVTAYQSLNISGGYRTVLPEITYAGHQYDDVLGMYYAKARMYDAENRRFAGVDPVKGLITEPMSMVQYLYVLDNPLRWVDPLGLTVYIDSISSESNGTILTGNDETGRPIQVFRDNRNYLGLRALIEDGFGGKITNYGYDESNNLYVSYQVKNVNGEIIEGTFEKIGCYERDAVAFVENGRTYIQVRAFAEALGYEDCLSYWGVENQDVTDVLIQRNMSNDSIIVTQEGNIINIKAYVNFTGDAADMILSNGLTYKQAAINGIEKYWNTTIQATKYDSFGIYANMVVHVEVITPEYNKENSNQKYLEYSISDARKRAHTSATSATLRHNTELHLSLIGNKNVPKITAFTYIPVVDGTYKAGTLDSIGWVAAHEFGHALGLRDAYKDGIAMNYNDEVLMNSIMASHGGTVTANDIEMLILARKLNEAQSYFDEELQVKVDGSPRTVFHGKSQAVVTDIYP